MHLLWHSGVDEAVNFDSSVMKSKHGKFCPLFAQIHIFMDVINQ